ncbi:MAG: sigma-70 family RNA polymerase sigma factor [Bacteroidota bacterium]|nr:sigma-70 family RNA polymerase sigma factor [Bacteroidota bacterium]
MSAHSVPIVAERAATERGNPRLTVTWMNMEGPDKVFNEVIDGCLKGERRSQQRVYELFYGKMMTVCLRYTKNTDQAKDILQDGFIKVFQSMEKFNRAGSFEGWIRRIMVNTAIDHFRRTKNSYLLLGEDRSIEDFSDRDEEDVIADESDDEELDLKPADVINAMQKLTPAYRTVFNLYVFEEMTHKEIAEMLGINVGTSKSNLAKAKHNLKKLLTQERKLH